MLEVLITGVSAGAAEGGPAGAAAGIIVAVVSSVVSKMADYQPVVTNLAAKPTSQIYVEGLRAQIAEEQRELRIEWTQNRDEIVKKETVNALQAFAKRIEDAGQLVRSSYYPKLTAGYLTLAPQRAEIELVTPHAEYTGEGRGFKVFQGPAEYVTHIRSRDIYVELNAIEVRII